MTDEVKKTEEVKKEDKPKFEFPEGGKFDADGFWIMPEGDFYDPDGVHFSKDGKDQYGGYYNDKGQYVHSQQKGFYLHKVFIPKTEGAKFNQAGFYELPNGAFYDPLGNYFDEKGFDAMGGFYNDLGEYQQGKIQFDEEDNEVISQVNPQISKYEQMYKQMYNQEIMQTVDPENALQDKLQLAQEIQQTIDQAEEKPGLCVKQYQKVADVKIQLKQIDQDGVEVNKVSIKKQQSKKE